jgi:hypothetical protein
MRHLKLGILAITVVASMSLVAPAFADQLSYTPEIPVAIPSVIPSPSPLPSPIPSSTESLTSAPTSAPTGIDMRPYLGIIAGLDFASVEHNDPGTGHRDGYQIGANIELPIFVWLWFQPELKYVQKGYSIFTSPVGTSVNATVPFNYLEMPLHAKVKLAQGVVAPFCILGPSFAVKLSGGNGDIGDGESAGTNLRTWDISFDIGLGTDVQVSANTKLFVSFEYSAGLLTIVPGTDFGNRNVQLIAGWNFAL